MRFIKYALAALLASVSATSYAQFVIGDGHSSSRPQELDGIYLESISANGSGCALKAEEKIDYYFAGDVLWIEFPAGMQAKKGAGLSLVQSRKNCAVTLTFKDRHNRSIGIKSAAFLGYATLPKAAKADLSLNYFFQGDAEQAHLSSSLTGTYNNYWVNEFRAADKQLYSPCGGGRALTLNTAIRVSGGEAKAQVSAGTLVLGVRLAKKACQG